jgi:uncharacterized membrane protein YcaP (DUF421 family)
LNGIDWEGIFLPTIPVLELILRGTLVYLGLFLLLRLILKRESGTVGLADLLFVVLLASAVQNSLLGESQSVMDGFVLVATIVIWNYGLNWLGYRFPKFNRLVHPAPLKLVKDGQLLYRNMRRELITESELMTQLRKQGVDDFSHVKEAYMEGDGSISVITDNGQTTKTSEKKVR